MSRITQIIDALEDERADAAQRLEWIERQIGEFRRHEATNGGGPAADAGTGTAGVGRRAGRRPARKSAAPAAGRRTSSIARTPARPGTLKGQIVEYLRANPGSTAGDVARGLDLKPNSTSTRLSQMAKAGLVEKAERGYAAR